AAPAPLMSFVARLNANGTALKYATLFGSATGWTQFPKAVAVDASGAPVVVGSTNGPDFPTTPGAFDRPLHGSTHALATPFDATGSRLVFSTYLGGSPESDPNSPFYQMGGGDEADAVGFDPSGSIVVSGQTSSPDFPTTPGAYSRAISRMVQGTLSTGRVFSLNDAFGARLHSPGSPPTYGTVLGGP